MTVNISVSTKTKNSATRAYIIFVMISDIYAGQGVVLPPVEAPLASAFVLIAAIIFTFLLALLVALDLASILSSNGPIGIIRSVSRRPIQRYPRSNIFKLHLFSERSV